ncbi:MAG: exosortase C-terminal domain/associated protein EpsI [Leptospirales bacterium]
MSYKSVNMLISAAMMMIAFVLLLRSKDHGIIPSHAPLSTFPVQIADWSGIQSPLSHKERSILNADGYLSILYTHRSGEEPLLFFSAYYDHQTPEKTIHSPQDCLPSSGWTILHLRKIPMYLYGDHKPPVSVNYGIIQKGLEKQLVIYWYQERGRIYTNEYLGRMYLIKDALLLQRTDGALVRVSMALHGPEEKGLQAATHFLQNVVPILPSYIPGRILKTGASDGKVARTSWPTTYKEGLNGH